MNDNLMLLATYDPNNLINALIEKLKLKNDAALARKLEVAPPVISKIRHGRLGIGASILISMHEESGLSIRELRDLMGDTRKGLFREPSVNDKRH